MKKSLMLFLIFFLLMPSFSHAEKNLSTREEVFRFLNLAFNTQVALSEELRTKEEISTLLNPYFSHSYQKKFGNENIVEEEGRYLTYGSDFALILVIQIKQK
jgi:Protein of unknown function (DUF3993)